MKLNRINILCFKVFTLLSIHLVAMHEEPKIMQKVDTNYYPFVNFVNKTQYPVNILLQSVQYYMSQPYTLKPEESINLDLSEKTMTGKIAPINNLKIGYATGISSYAPMQNISDITREINNYQTKAELFYMSKQKTLHLKVIVEILADNTSWTQN